MKRIIAILCCAALLFTLAGCSSTGTTTEDYSNTTLTGQVVSVDGNTVTLQLGELSEDEAQKDGTQDTDQKKTDSPAEQSTDQAQPSDEDSSGKLSGEPPAKPDGDNGGEPPAKPDDSQSAGTDEQGSAPSGEPPAKPDGDNGNAPAGQSGGEPPAKPDGDNSGQHSGKNSGKHDGKKDSVTFTPGEDTATIDLSGVTIAKKGKGSEEMTAADLKEGDILVIVFGDDNAIESVTLRNVKGDSGMSEGGSQNVDQGTAATTIDKDGTYSGETYTSEGDDENALRVTGATVTLEGITADKRSGSCSDGDAGNFYGMNAALLATDGAQVTIQDATVTSSAQCGNGVFSYGSGTVVNISDSKITTTGDNSGGIMTTGGGTTNASNLTVETSGNSSAAIRSDRGGGTVNVTGGTYTSSGYNSPAVYSTAAISVSGAALTADNSEALVIEGKNSIALTDCEVSGSMSNTKGVSSDVNVHNVMIYQSMSGDAEEGTSSFSMEGGSLTGNSGDLFFITNTHCTIDLSGVTIENKDADGNFMTVTGTSHNWGTPGENGGQAEITASHQTFEGNIVVDTISTLNMDLTDGSHFTGTVNIVDNAEGGAAVENNAVITIGEGCTWTLTGN